MSKTLIGLVFGRLTVSSQAESKNKRKHWLCRCSCGGQKTVSTNGLKTGAVKSCGCLAIEHSALLNKKHGLHKTPEYKVWQGIKRRCYFKSSRNFKYYGGRGITMCSEWVKSFESFLKDVGHRPSKQHSIDRIDVNGNYEPSNCRWSLVSTQRHNTRPRKNKHAPGVVFRNNEYVARIQINNKRINLGSFKEKKEAAEAYCKAKKQIIISDYRD